MDPIHEISIYLDLLHKKQREIVHRLHDKLTPEEQTTLKMLNDKLNEVTLSAKVAKLKRQKEELETQLLESERILKMLKHSEK
jgi:hypothetical protein